MLKRPDFLRVPSGLFGAGAVLLLTLIAVLGPFAAPYLPDEPIGGAGELPSAVAWLGTDFLGRDVLSRLLHGGVTVLGFGIVSTLLVYLVGITIGVVAGARGGWLDMLLMRCIDIMMSFPSIVILLLLAIALGPSITTILAGVVLCEIMSVSRIVRTATMELMPNGYIVAARARGEPLHAIVLADILPNIGHLVLADLGVRFGFCVGFVVSMNYLGLGLQPPLADWGLMIAENRQFLAANPWCIAAPAILLTMLSIGVNLMADAYVKTRHRSGARGAVQSAAGGAP